MDDANNQTAMKQAQDRFPVAHKTAIGSLTAILLAVLLSATSTISIGCSPTKPRPFLVSSAAGHRAYDAGRFEEAARYFAKAAKRAGTTRDRDEYLYLEAATYQRTRKWDKALARYVHLLHLSPHGDRAPRVAYELASLQWKHVSEAKGLAGLNQFVKTYPSSGLARQGFMRLVEHEEDVHGLQGSIDYLRRHIAWCDANYLGEQARYALAMRLQRANKLAQARDEFIHCARKYPYPKGLLFDDALYRASALDVQLGHPKLAIKHLQWMLSFRETSTMSGSYQRPKYAKAQMRIAEIYRDELHDHAAARREFHRLYRFFKTSTLRDDALWEEGRLAREDKLERQACRAMKSLRRDFPESRYAACAHALCPALKEDDARNCHPYVLRELDKRP